MKKAIRIISNILFVVLAVSLILGILIFLIPRFTPVQYRAVRTGSMEPDIPVGSMVVVVPTPADEIQVGDDVTYITQSNQAVTHRVLEIDSENNVFTTYGIANGANNTDPPLAYENIIGVAKFHIPWIGSAITYLDTLSGKIVAVTVILAIALLGAPLSAIANSKKDKQNVLPAVQNDNSRDTPIPFKAEENKPSSTIEKPEKHSKKERKTRPEATDAFWNGDDGQ